MCTQIQTEFIKERSLHKDIAYNFGILGTRRYLLYRHTLIFGHKARFAFRVFF